MITGTSQDCLREFLEHVPEPLRTEVNNRLSEIRRNKGQSLIVENDLSRDVFFLRKGQAEVRLYPFKWPEVYIHTLSPGDMFGELAALDGKPRSASIEALSNLVADRLCEDDFMACLESSPAAGIWLARRLVLSVRRLTERVFELRALNVSGRIHCELLRLADKGERTSEGIVINPAPTHQELADRAGTHREAVTRELGYLSKVKIIRRKKRKLVIIDLAALEKSVQR
jgi:CRP/FNR family cyclic AMP-dependent transcriptional regulator